MIWANNWINQLIKSLIYLILYKKKLGAFENFSEIWYVDFFDIVKPVLKEIWLKMH